MELQLIEGVRVKVHHFALVKQDYEVYRVVLHFISDQPDKNRLIKEYYVWLTDVFTDDFLHINRKTTEEDFKTVALALAQKRFDECGDVPPEGGLNASNEEGIVKIPDAINFIHPIERKP